MNNDPYAGTMQLAFYAAILMGFIIGIVSGFLIWGL